MSEYLQESEEWSLVEASSEKDVNGFYNVLQEITDRYIVGFEKAKNAISEAPDVIVQIMKQFDVSESEAHDILKRLPAYKAPAGSKPKYWQTRPKTSGAQKTAVNRDITHVNCSQMFEKDVSLHDYKELFEKEDDKEKGIMLFPYVTFVSYDMTAHDVHGPYPYNSSLSAQVSHGYCITLQERKSTSGETYYRFGVRVSNERNWSSKSIEELEAHEQTVLKSVNIAHRELQKALKHPYRGGLPGYGKRN